MEKMIGCCGLPCHECGAFLATQHDDDVKRKEVAELWSKEYQKDIRPEDINCDGCVAVDGIHFDYCNVCEIRKCARARSVANCAHCDDYGCDTITRFFEIVPACKTRLDEIRAAL